MKGLRTLLLICHIASSASHSLWFSLSVTSEMPEFSASLVVDGVKMGYCDSNSKSVKSLTPWIKNLFEDYPLHRQWLTSKCIGNWHDFRATITSLMMRFNHSKGIHTFQRMNGCYLDELTGDYTAFNQYGYDGKDLISFDLETMTWITPQHQTVITKHNWNRDGDDQFWKFALTEECRQFLQMYLTYGESSLQAPVPPSVSLLQKTPSSPVTCHATGFYPDRAEMFWKKDGEEVHDGVNTWEILPNNDGTFQMSADLDISSVSPEDWQKYDCVFQLSGLKDSITTRLDHSRISTNFESPSRKHFAVVFGIVLFFSGLVSVLVLVIRRNRSE